MFGLQGAVRRFSLLPSQRLNPLVRQVLGVVLQSQGGAMGERAEPRAHVIQMGLGGERLGSHRVLFNRRRLRRRLVYSGAAAGALRGLK